MRNALFLAVLLGGFCLAAGDETTRLFNGKDTSNWTVLDKGREALWSVAGKVELDPKDPKKLVASGQAEGDNGVLFASIKDFQGTNLISKEQFGDMVVSAEFLLPKEGNSGLYLMGRYEFQLTDSFGLAEDKMTEGEMGGIPFFRKPLRNASGKPGEWQTVEVEFNAPKFDASGKKTANAKIVKAIINGKVVQENLELPEPTGGAIDTKEAAKGPLMLQGNEGPVAYRNVRVKAK